MTPSLGSIYFLEQLTELKETFYILNYPFIRKGYNSGTARWKRCVGQGTGRGVELPWHSSQIPTSSPTQKPPNPLLLGFYGVVNSLSH